MLFTLKLISGEVIQHNVKSDIVTIGRSKNSSIVAAYDGISRNHCQIEFSNGEIFVTDLGSTNGVYIDGTKIDPNSKIPYQTYLTLSIGSIQSLTIEFDDKTGVQYQTSVDSITEAVKTTKQFNDSQMTKTTTYLETLNHKTSDIKVKPKKSSSQDFSSDKKNTKIPVKKQERKNSIVTNFVALLLFVGAIFWYVTKGENIEGNEEMIKTDDTKSSGDADKNFEQF
jgi:predicted component of type VI protein secretion system